MSKRIPSPESRIPTRVVVIGIGNEFRQDDGVGIEVARHVRRLSLPGVLVLERGGEGTGLMSDWSEASNVIVVDAVSSGAPPGTIHRFEIGPHTGAPMADAGVPSAGIFRGTSHQIGLGEAIELAAAVDALPDRLVVYGVEGQAFGEGAGLTPAVASEVEELVARIADEARRLATDAGGQADVEF